MIHIHSIWTPHLGQTQCSFLGVDHLLNRLCMYAHTNNIKLHTQQINGRLACGIVLVKPLINQVQHFKQAKIKKM